MITKPLPDKRKKTISLDVGNAKVIVSFLNQVTISMTPVERVMAMLWGILTRESIIDFIIVERVYIRDATIMRKRLIRFLSGYLCLMTNPPVYLID